MLFNFFIRCDSGKLTVQCSHQTDLNKKLNWIVRQTYPHCIPEPSRSTDFTSISLPSIHPLHKNTSLVFKLSDLVLYVYCYMVHRLVKFLNTLLLSHWVAYQTYSPLITFNIHTYSPSTTREILLYQRPPSLSQHNFQSSIPFLPLIFKYISRRWSTMMYCSGEMSKTTNAQ